MNLKHLIILKLIYTILNSRSQLDTNFTMYISVLNNKKEHQCTHRQCSLSSEGSRRRKNIDKMKKL